MCQHSNGKAYAWGGAYWISGEYAPMGKLDKIEPYKGAVLEWFCDNWHQMIL